MLRSPADIGSTCCCVPFSGDPDLQLHTVLCFGFLFWLLTGKFELQKKSELMSNLHVTYCSEYLVMELIPPHSSKCLTAPVCPGTSRWTHGSTGVKGSPVPPLKAWLRSGWWSCHTHCEVFSPFPCMLELSLHCTARAHQAQPCSADILALTIPKLGPRDALMLL